MPTYFAYSEEELECLRQKDRRLARVMDIVGPVRREVMPDLFSALMYSIVGQQVSTKAHRAIWERVQERLGQVCPERIGAAEPEALRACGLSLRKVEYMQGAAEEVLSGRLDLAALQKLDDAAVCERLSALRGVGQWTAEMLLIFSLQRRDVLSWQDLGIRRGLRMLYRHRELTPERFARYKKRYSPCGTLASLYLWELSCGRYEGYSDPAAAAGRKKDGK